jgi:hypothetical protein
MLATCLLGGTRQCRTATVDHNRLEADVSIGKTSKTDIEAGGNVSVESETGKILARYQGRAILLLLGTNILAVGGGGWLYRGRQKESRALMTLVDAIEEGDCKDCKRCVAARSSPYINERVARLTGKKRGQ